MNAPPRAVVFAYHNVGMRGLAVLLSLGVEVPLVVTHQDHPDENIWFGSVQRLAEIHGIPTITPKDPNTPEVIQRVWAGMPAWLFSFYYRHLLGPKLLAVPASGAYNLHGSLLPHYRGRAPVNWAVLHGETKTGVSLHRMVAKPDAGALVDQEPVPILPNDTAFDVFQKVTSGAEILLLRALPAVLVGEHREMPLDLSAGSCFGARRPEDGRIDWRQTAWQVHNLIRAVAPPYPGAFTDIGATRLQVLGSYFRDEPTRGGTPRIYWENSRCYADCVDRRRILFTSLAVDDKPLTEPDFVRRFGGPERNVLV